MPGPEYRAVRELRKALAPPVVVEREDSEAAPMLAFVQANPDPLTWTNAQLRLALVRLIRMELRRRGLLAEQEPAP